MGVLTITKDRLTIGVDVPGEKVGDKSVPVTVTVPCANTREKIGNITKKKLVVNILLILISLFHRYYLNEQRRVFPTLLK